MKANLRPFLASAALGALAAALIVFFRQPTAPTQPTPNSQPQTPTPPPAAPAPEPEPQTPNSQLQTPSAPPNSADELAALETLAAADWNAALARALRENNVDHRNELLQAVIRGWASKDIRAAGLWAKHQTYLLRDLAVAAVFNGGTKNPAAAETYARELTAADPAHASDYGNYLVHGLGRAGHHAAAARWAAGYSTEIEKNWMVAAYHAWGQHDPHAALASLVEIPDPLKHRTALQALYTGWSLGNPEELAKIAIDMPEGQDRKIILTAALRIWFAREPSAAADWVSKQKFTPEMEAALEE